MSNDVKEAKKAIKEEVKAVEAQIDNDFAGKTNDELKEAYQNLTIQFQEHQRLAGQHSQLAMKCQGGMETIAQLLPQNKEDQVDG
jgi:hypothetical protein